MACLDVTCSGHKLQRAAVGKSGEEGNLLGARAVRAGRGGGRQQLPDCTWWQMGSRALDVQP